MTAQGGNNDNSRFVSATRARVLLQAEAKDGWIAYGWGTKSCGAWTKVEAHRQPVGAEVGSNIAAQTSWIVGFISAFNYYQGATPDVTEGTDISGVFAWIDNYCATHPLDPINHAVLALIAQLSQRQ